MLWTTSDMSFAFSARVMESLVRQKGRERVLDWVVWRMYMSPSNGLLQSTSLSPSVNPLDDPLYVFLYISGFLALQFDDGFCRVGGASVVGDYAHDLGLVVLLNLFERVTSVIEHRMKECKMLVSTVIF